MSKSKHVSTTIQIDVELELSGTVEPADWSVGLGATVDDVTVDGLKVGPSGVRIKVNMNDPGVASLMEDIIEAVRADAEDALAIEAGE